MADEVVLTDIYSAGVEPLAGVTVEAVAEEVRRAGGGHVQIVKALADVPAAVARLARAGGLVLTRGARSLRTTGPQGVGALASCCCCRRKP